MKLVAGVLGNYIDRMRGIRLRVAVVTSNLAKFDGISGGARHTILAATSVPEWKVSVFASHNEFDEIPVHVVHGARKLSSHSDFRAADVVIYHFGFHHDLFEIMKSGNGHCRQIVAFHNITPEQYVPSASRAAIRKSFEQLENLRHSDWLWPISKTNASVLLAAGIDPARIEIMPPAVEWPPAFELGAKAMSTIKILFVGRITQSKGVLDLVRAVDLLRSRCSIPFRVSIVGKFSSGDEGYYAGINDMVATCGLAQAVQIRGRTESDQLAALYRDAHILAIPSYHEGFCRPVVEGLRAGCVPVGYSAYNLPLVANGLGRLVPAGDIGALADSLALMAEAIARTGSDPSTARLPLDGGPLSIAEFEAAAAEHVSQFSFDNLSRRVTDRIRVLTGVQPSPASAW